MSALCVVALLAMAAGASATWYTGRSAAASSGALAAAAPPIADVQRRNAVPLTSDPAERAKISRELQAYFKCDTPCSSNSECLPYGTSCFFDGVASSSQGVGCCLPALRPNETKCDIDEQCSRTCATSFCDRTQTPSRCLCSKGRHFLFMKCWIKCPAFARSEPEVDATGFSACIVENSADAFRFMRLVKRQVVERQRVFC